MAYTKIGSYQTNGRNIYGAALDTYFFGVDVYVESSDAINYDKLQSLFLSFSFETTEANLIKWIEDNNLKYTSTITYFLISLLITR